MTAASTGIYDSGGNNKSGSSHHSSTYKSTPTSRSGVLERAREFQQRKKDPTPRNSTSSYNNPAMTRNNNNSNNTPTASTPGSVPTQAQNFASPRTPNTPSTAVHRDSHTGSTKKNSARKLAQQQQPPYDDNVPNNNNHHNNNEGGGGGVVSPELLVDALSGHEDGLLAIAERLMEHYDAGYDAMGEAIIDAFADVQKLFQHVVEAAHMEGAAFEASRREEELKDKQHLQQQQFLEDGMLPDDDLADIHGGGNGGVGGGSMPAGPIRHDEFIDQDVKDCLTDAIRKGAVLKEQGKHMDCYELYEQACQSASALLPVDSDHRGRLQLSIARAESMAPDRGCAILRYAMDDVLRSAMRAGKVPLPDPSKRADVVLSKPTPVHPSMNGSGGGMLPGVVQSTEEQLNSLVEEMKEILDAPVYKDTPLQDVAKRFWVALMDAQKHQSRNEERLEQNLGKLKGEFLLARAEWEEKLTRAEEQADHFKRKYMSNKGGGNPHPYHSHEADTSTSMMDDAKSISQRMFSPDNEQYKRAPSVASLGSSMAQHARNLVGNFACAGLNTDRTAGGVLDEENTTFQKGHHQQPAQQQWREANQQRRREPHTVVASADYRQQQHPSVVNESSNSNKSYRETAAAASTRMPPPRHVDV